MTHEIYDNLFEVTRQESGIVLYPASGSPEAVICNWSGVEGLPRVFVTGILGLGESLTVLSKAVVEGRAAFEDLCGSPADWDVLYDENGDAETFFDTASRWTVYSVSAANDAPVTVIAPDGWN